ncbi:MAG: lipopolysaccharide biosynthesis protein [Bacteroidota bacterium]
MSTLKEKAVNGVIWSVAERFGNQGIQFIIGLILARLLMPEDYGLIGMLLVFISIAQVFVEGGFSAALIRKSEPTNRDYSTVFWFNLVVAFVFYVIIFLCSPLISEFYQEPLLAPLAKVVALNIIISAFGIIQKTILTKQLDFKSQAKVNLSSIIISGVIGVVCAWQGLGVWALVVQNLSKNILMNIGFWILSSWRPMPIFSERSFKELFGFGSKLLASALINAVSENLYAIIIGKLYNAKSLGFYTRANQFQKLPVSSIYGAIGAVTYPVLAKLQHNNDQLKEGYRSMFRIVAFTLFPVMTILGVVAEPLIRVVLTEKWLPCVTLLQILCIEGAFYPLQAINLDLLKVKGRSDLFLKLEVIKQFFTVLTIVVFFRWGVYGLVWGLIALSIVCYYINTFYSKRLLDYGIIDQIKDLLVFIFMNGLMLLFLLGLKYIITNNMFQLIILPPVGVLFYAVLSNLFKVKELVTLREIFMKLVSKKRVTAL